MPGKIGSITSVAVASSCIIARASAMRILVYKLDDLINLRQRPMFDRCQLIMPVC